MKNDEYVVSDHNGNYIAYTSNLGEAKEIAEEGNHYLSECDEEGSYVVGIKTPDGYTFDCL